MKRINYLSTLLIFYNISKRIMKITIKTLKGQTFSLEVLPQETIQNLKEKIQEIKHFDIDSQKIVFKGKATTNTDRIDQLGIKENDFLVIMILTKKPEPKVVQKKVETNSKQQQKGQKKQQKPTEEKKPIISQTKPSENADFNAKVDELTKMGFPKDQCQQALRAAFHNSDRAVQYLLNGIPSQPLQPQGGSQTNFLSGIVNNPNFAQIRELIRNDPNALNGILQQLQTTSPQLYNIISQHPQQFERMILEGEDDQFDEQGQGQQGGILVTPEQQQAINRLVMLGFSKGDAAQAYFACDKSQEMAANLLFDRLAKGDIQQSGGDMEGEQDEDDDNLFN